MSSSPPLSPTNAAQAKADWHVDPNCPAHLAVELTNVVMDLPTSYFLAPHSGEVFGSVEAALARLNGYALTQGFAVVKSGGSEHSKKPYISFKCIHHGAQTRNYRGLERHIRRDADGVIVSNRKEENTSTMKRDCQVGYGLSFRQLVRGSGIKEWILKVHEGSKHSHELAPYGLRYDIHKRQTESHRQALELAKTHREAFLTYSESVRVLDQAGLSIDRTTYYHLKRQTSASSHEGFQALIASLEEAGFLYRCRFEEQVNISGAVTAIQLEQIWFTLPAQVELGRRFVSDFVLLLDGTFSTNALNLVLIIAYGVTNTDKTFPLCLSFARSESKMSFDFILSSMKLLIFAGQPSASQDGEATGKSFQANQNLPLPRVIISDQAKGLIAALPICLPTTTLQLCDWHVSQNIRKRLAEKKYTKAERELINDRVWGWIKARTEGEVETAQSELFALLQYGEINYLKEHWLPKKEKFLRFYTRRNANVGCNSNQRSEGKHPQIKKVLNHQLPIEETTRRLAQTIKQELRDLETLESQQGTVLPRTLDVRVFGQVLDYITRFAIDMVSTEWEMTKAAIDSGKLGYDDYGTDCHCHLLARYSLPCRHWLLLHYLRGSQIPKSLFHPRWWIRGPVVTRSNWKPTEFAPEAAPLLFNPHAASNIVQNTLTNISLQALQVRDTLQGVAQAEYDQALLQANRALVNEAELIRKRFQLPILPMAPVEKATFLKPSRGAHGKTTTRSLTGTESAEREANREEAAAKMALNKAPTAPTEEELWDTIEVVPGPPPHSGDPYPSPEPPILELPPSTRAGALEGARNKRARAASGYYSALQAGDSQEARDKRQRQ